MPTGRQTVACGQQGCGARNAVVWSMLGRPRAPTRRALMLLALALDLSACGSEPPPPVAQPEPVRPTFEQLAAQCLSLVDQGLTAIRRAADATTTDWRVQLQNPCQQPIPALVEFWVLDRNNAAIGYEARRVTAPANAAFEATGQIIVPRAQAAAIASTITRYGAEPSQAALPAPVAVQVATTSPTPVAMPATAVRPPPAATQPATTTTFGAPAAAAIPAPRAAPSMATSLAPLVAPAMAPPISATGAGRGDPAFDMTVLGMTWQGTAAVVQVELVNGTGAPVQESALTCDFIALDQILGRGVQRVPALRQGERTTVTVTGEVGGQLVDRVLCTGT